MAVTSVWPPFSQTHSFSTTVFCTMRTSPLSQPHPFIQSRRYMAFVSLEKLFRVFPDELRRTSSGSVWEGVQASHTHNHSWVRLAAARLLGVYFADERTVAGEGARWDDCVRLLVVPHCAANRIRCHFESYGHHPKKFTEFNNALTRPLPPAFHRVEQCIDSTSPSRFSAAFSAVGC